MIVPKGIKLGMTQVVVQYNIHKFQIYTHKQHIFSGDVYLRKYEHMESELE